MVRVLRSFRRRSTSPETIEEERPCERPTKRPSSGFHVPGKVISLELQTNTLFQDHGRTSTPEGCSLETIGRDHIWFSEHTVGQAPYKVVGT
eukprot:10151143-Heterocapsa_arctica.AAC.1